MYHTHETHESGSCIQSTALPTSFPSLFPRMHREVGKQLASETPPLMILYGWGTIVFLGSAQALLLPLSPTWPQMWFANDDYWPDDDDFLANMASDALVNTSSFTTPYVFLSLMLRIMFELPVLAIDFDIMFASYVPNTKSSTLLLGPVIISVMIIRFVLLFLGFNRIQKLLIYSMESGMRSGGGSRWLN